MNGSLPMNAPRFAGRRVLVTGASSGIGRATALLLAREGARVAVSGRNVERLDALAREAADASGSVERFPGDLTDGAFRERLVGEALARLGGLDGLVNAAGIIGSGDWAATDLDAWDRMLDINLRAVFDLTR